MTAGEEGSDARSMTMTLSFSSSKPRTFSPDVAHEGTSRMVDGRGEKGRGRGCEKDIQGRRVCGEIIKHIFLAS